MTQTEALDLDAAESRALSALAAWNGVEDVTHGEEERRVDAALRDLLPLVEELRRTNGDLAVAVAEATQARNDRDRVAEENENLRETVIALAVEDDPTHVADFVKRFPQSMHLEFGSVMAPVPEARRVELARELGEDRWTDWNWLLARVRSLRNARAAVEAVRALLATTRTLQGADPDTGDWEVSALALIDALGPVAETGEQR